MTYIQLEPMTGFCAVCKEPVPMKRTSLKLRKLCGKLRCVSDYMTRLNRERHARPVPDLVAAARRGE